MGRARLTAPFAGHIKPARAGWYLVQFPMGWTMKWWDGLVWRLAPAGVPIERQGRPWRGLARKPAARWWADRVKGAK
jgi:hypothetical protein